MPIIAGAASYNLLSRGFPWSVFSPTVVLHNLQVSIEYRNIGKRPRPWFARNKFLCYNSCMIRLLHIALILALATHSWAAGAVSFACRMTGDVSSVCCCAKSTESACDVIQAARHCCDVRIADTAATPAGVRTATPGPEDNHHPAWTSLASISAQVQPKMPKGFARALARFDSSSPPPIILLSQSFRC